MPAAVQSRMSIYAISLPITVAHARSEKRLGRYREASSALAMFDLGAKGLRMLAVSTLLSRLTKITDEG